MRNVAISVVIFIIMILAMTISLSYLNKITNNLENLNMQIETYINDRNWDEANKAATDFSEKWDKYTNIIKLFVNHQELDNIEIELSKLTQFVREKTPDESLANVHTLDFLLNHITNLEKINLQNIF
ncbi:DUF4363 family protein [Candidatus Clostridium stratigraminis]|uniref:DUF4363 family protein n=1 Tax=Candidatus Clostridium stratigraminis TaxID=3381661 RepID=A0ABW8T1V1_9CLOT